MELINAIMLLFASFVIIFQFFFINFIQNKNEEYLKFSEEILKIAKENKEMYITLIEAYKLKLECYENKNK